jgi:hypothetical protein
MARQNIASHSGNPLRDLLHRRNRASHHDAAMIVGNSNWTQLCGHMICGMPLQSRPLAQDRPTHRGPHAMTKRLCGAVLLTLLLAVHPAAAQELRIGLSAEPSSIDPLFFTFAPNNLVRTHIFDQLVHFDGHGHLIPGLAESWESIDDTTWEFRLRPDVTFHDGSALTPDDVTFSIDPPTRCPTVPVRSPSTPRQSPALRSRAR